MICFVCGEEASQSVSKTSEDEITRTRYFCNLHNLFLKR